MKLLSKIYLLTLGSLLSTSLFVSFVALSGLKKSLADEFNLRTLTVTRTFAHVAAMDLQDKHLDVLQDFMDSLLSDPDLEEAHLIDIHGNLLASKVRGATGLIKFRPQPDMFTSALNSFVPQIREMRDATHWYKVSYQRIYTESNRGVETLGVGYTKFSFYRLDKEIRQTTWELVSTIALFTVLALLLAYLLSSHTLGPIQELRKAAEAIGHGDFSASLPVQLKDEIGQLARSFEKMAREVQSAQRHLEDRVQERTQQLEASRASLVQSDKLAAVGQLAAGVAHELNNPLGVIRGFAETALDFLPPGHQLKTALESIERESIRCKTLVENLLVFSRTTELEHREESDINEPVEAALMLVSAESKMKHSQLVKELTPGLPQIMANKSQIQQIVINLCNNALDAMPKGGTLTVRTGKTLRDDKSFATLSVADTGEGIPEAIRKRIFEPFFTTKEVGKGTGLGLSLVYEIVQKHGGTVDLQSEEGKGTIFIIHFPALKTA